MKTTKTLFRPHLRINAGQEKQMEDISEFWRKAKGREIDPHTNSFWYELLAMSYMAVENEKRILAEIEAKKKELRVLK